MVFSRLFKAFRKRSANTAPSASPASAPDLSPEGLSALFGEQGVRSTTSITLTPAPTLINAESKFGGLPGFLCPTPWPRCPSCRDPMMFIGQLAIGPDSPLKFPVQAVLYLFLCQSDPTAEPECETWSAESGCAVVFAQSGSAERKAPDESFLRTDSIAALAAAVCEKPDQTHALWDRLNQRGNKEFRATLFGQYSCRLKPGLSVCAERLDGSELTPAHYAAMAALRAEGSLFIGGFPDWVQEPRAPRCRCGEEMEFVLQFGAFDAALNLGDAGEAYVFACPRRCSPTSFALEWQCC